MFNKKLINLYGIKLIKNGDANITDCMAENLENL